MKIQRPHDRQDVGASAKEMDQVVDTQSLSIPLKIFFCVTRGRKVRSDHDEPHLGIRTADQLCRVEENFMTFEQMVAKKGHHAYQFGGRVEAEFAVEVSTPAFLLTYLADLDSVRNSDDLGLGNALRDQEFLHRRRDCDRSVINPVGPP